MWVPELRLAAVRFAQQTDTSSPAEVLLNLAQAHVGGNPP
jgi:hypothetical protein